MIFMEIVGFFAILLAFYIVLIQIHMGYINRQMEHQRKRIDSATTDEELEQAVLEAKHLGRVSIEVEKTKLRQRRARLLTETRELARK